MKLALCLILLLPASTWALECSFRSHAELGQLVLSRIQNLRCSPKRIHLTFDDGPHPQYTPMILEELRLRNVKATFFVSTTNIAPDHLTQRNIVNAEMDAGHSVGSHGHEHEAYDVRMANGQVLPSLSPEEKSRQIRLYTRYLNEATHNRFGRQHPLLYRFPYGRGVLPSDAELDEIERRGDMRFSSRDRLVRLREYRALSAPLHAIADSGYGHLLWNHDSEDSTASAPANDPASKAQFISRNLAGLCSSPNADIVSLFHDIKPFNPEVVAVLIDLGKCLGMNFVDQKTILQASALSNAGTYISREHIQATPVRRLDEIGRILESLGPDCPEESPPAPGSCYSQDAQRTFRDCESGEVSICIRGSWFRKTEEKLQECRARGL